MKADWYSYEDPFWKPCVNSVPCILYWLIGEFRHWLPELNGKWNIAVNFSCSQFSGWIYYFFGMSFFWKFLYGILANKAVYVLKSSIKNQEFSNYKMKYSFRFFERFLVSVNYSAYQDLRTYRKFSSIFGGVGISMSQYFYLRFSQ